MGGNTLGLYGGVFSSRGNLILAHGYQGAFHLWKKAGMDDSSDLELWQPLPAPSGHFGPVQDLSWEPDGGKFLLSVSSDQTTRLHAPWKQEEGVVSYAPSKCFTVQVKDIFLGVRPANLSFLLK